LLLYVVIARFLYSTFIIYSAIRLPSRKCAINSVFSVQDIITCVIFGDDRLRGFWLAGCQGNTSAELIFSLD